MTTNGVGRVLFHLIGNKLVTKSDTYAAKIGMSLEDMISSLANDWENGFDGIIKSIQEGDYENFLDAELENHDQH
jgi:hypothetical protein